jgi:hypothetical protein
MWTEMKRKVVENDNADQVDLCEPPMKHDSRWIKGIQSLSCSCRPEEQPATPSTTTTRHANPLPPEEYNWEFSELPMGETEMKLTMELLRFKNQPCVKGNELFDGNDFDDNVSSLTSNMDF